MVVFCNSCGGGEQHRTRSRQSVGKCEDIDLEESKCIDSGAFETRICNPSCPNGGTPTSEGCKCRPGYKGTCCTEGDY